MARLLLVRHALPVIDPIKPPHHWQLDPAGAADLAALAARPEFRDVTRIVSSSEPKALATAAAVAGGRPIETCDDLRELHKTSFVGEEHDAVMQRVFAEPDRPGVPGWETAAAALARFRRAVERLIGETPGDLAVVSHGTVESLYLAYLAGQTHVNPARWRAVRMPDLAVIDTATRQLVQPFGFWKR